MHRIATAPNCITLVRIFGAVSLIFVPPLTTAFYVIYIICGVSDVLDGFIARMTHSGSDFGAKLDSIADLSFYGVVILRIMPELIKKLKLGVWIAVGITIAVRIGSYIVVAFRYRRFSSIHTYLNKLTGLVTFLIPCMIVTEHFFVFSIIGTTVGAVATLEEFVIHIIEKEYDSSKKTILYFIKK